MRSGTEPPKATASVRPCLAPPCCRRCCTRTRATSTGGTATSSSARCTPSRRLRSARATTVTGSPTTPTFWGISARPASRPSTIRAAIVTAYRSPWTTRCSASLKARSGRCSRNFCCAISRTAPRLKRHPNPDQNSPAHLTVSSSVFFDMVAVRSSLSQLNGLPSMARFIVLNSTIENTWR
jgi:hypothetical protein